MLAFQQQRESYYRYVVNTLTLKYPKHIDIDNSAPENRFERLINDDINAISIAGPTHKENEI